MSAPVTGFELYLKNNYRRVDKHLATYFADGGHRDMGRYLYGPLTEYTANGGKRHRPLICMLACEAVGGSPDRAMRAGAAIEHFHTAALIHDDIEDGADTRRGEPAMHVKLGIPLAINAGDLALSLVTGSVVTDPDLDAETKIAVLAELIDMTTRTIEGQALDIGWAGDGRFDISVEDYLFMAAHKTAYYSGGMPLAIGAIIGGADHDTTEALRAFGMAAGLAFQIQDDLINLVGSDKSKDFRIDITEGKRTLVVVHALANAEPTVRARLLEILGARTDDASLLAEAVAIMEHVGSVDYAREYALAMVTDAKAALSAALPKSKARDLLLGMADFFVARQS